MRQAWHIFKKDSRQFRYGIGLVLAWTALLAFSAPRWFELSTPGPGFNYGVEMRRVLWGVSGVVLPAAWCVLIALVVQADPLAGDRQFWVTRPFSRASLFGAKVLFVMAYLVLPLMGVQAILLWLSDMPAATWRTGLVWNAILMILMIGLPALGVAAVTRSFVQFTLVAALSLPAAEMMRSSAWLGIDWVRTTLAAAVAMAAIGSILWLQFARRRTEQSRVVGLSAILIAVTILVALPWQSAFSLQAAMRPLGSADAAAELLPPDLIPQTARSASGTTAAETVTVALSARAVGIEPGTPLACDAMHIDIEGPDGSRWSSELARYTRYLQQTQIAGTCSGLFRVPASYAGAAAVRLSGVVYVTATREGARVTLRTGQEPQVVDDVVCAARGIRTSAQPVMFVECRGAFGRQDGLHVGGQGSIGDLPRSYSPFPGGLAILPIRSRTLGVQGETVPVFKQYPAGHTALPLRPSTVRLADFVTG